MDRDHSKDVVLHENFDGCFMIFLVYSQTWYSDFLTFWVGFFSFYFSNIPPVQRSLEHPKVDGCSAIRKFQGFAMVSFLEGNFKITSIGT